MKNILSLINVNFPRKSEKNYDFDSMSKILTLFFNGHQKILIYLYVPTSSCIYKCGVLDLKKLIEYDQKYNYVSALSPTPNKDREQNYSERMKTSANKEAVDHNHQITRAAQPKSNINSKTLEKNIFIHEIIEYKSKYNSSE